MAAAELARRDRARGVLNCISTTAMFHLGGKDTDGAGTAEDSVSCGISGSVLETCRATASRMGDWEGINIGTRKTERAEILRISRESTSPTARVACRGRVQRSRDPTEDTACSCEDNWSP